MTAQHPQRCATCNKQTVDDYEIAHCSIDGRTIPVYVYRWIEIRGCASHSTPAPAAQQRIDFNSTELLLLAHDEWKRREERKHLHDELAWVAGFLNGFCTSHEWARKYVDGLQEHLSRGGSRNLKQSRSCRTVSRDDRATPAGIHHHRGTSQDHE
jgi:hypothetical protein